MPVTVVHWHVMTDDSPVNVEKYDEVLPPPTPDESVDLYNSGLTSRMVDVVGAYGSTTFKWCLAGSIVAAVKMLIGVTEYAFAVWAINSA